MSNNFNDDKNDPYEEYIDKYHKDEIKDLDLLPTRNKSRFRAKFDRVKWLAYEWRLKGLAGFKMGF